MIKKICAVLAVIMMLTLSLPIDVFADGSIGVSDTDALAAALANDTVTDIHVAGGTTLLPTDNTTSITIPSGKTVTFDSGGYFTTLSCPVVNNGTIINNNGNMSSYAAVTNASTGTFNNNAKFYNSKTILNQGTISNAGTFVNNTGATITNNGTFMNSGTFTNNGSLTGNAIVADTPVELINGSAVTYYPTFQDALDKINNPGYELRVLKDLTLEGSVTLPIVPFTLSGLKPGGGVSTLTINNGDFTLHGDATLKNINLAHTGSSGNFNIAWKYGTGIYEWNDYTLTVQSGVTFSDLNIVGFASTLYVQGTLDMGSKSISGVNMLSLTGGSLKVGSLNISNLSLSDGSTLDITGADGLTVTGSLTSGGTQTSKLLLPAPSDHGGTVYSAMLTNTTVNAATALELAPTAGADFTLKSKLIYLNNTVANDNSFVSGVSGLMTATRTLDSNQYLTLVNSTSTALASDKSYLIYGDTNFVLTAIVKDADNAAMTSGTVKFYKGTSADASNLLATVGVDGSGNAQCGVDAAVNTVVGNNEFYACYEESSDDYGPSSGTVTVPMNKKSLSLGSVKVSNKSYDGTTTASITEITLNASDIVGGDTVDVSATAVFQDAGAGTGKAVDLKGIQLSGADTGNYTIASTALNVATADITKATPAVQLVIAPAADAVSGDTVTLTATVAGVVSGAYPSGTVTFYNGSTELGMSNCSGGKATFTWSSVPAGTYSLSAQYAGDMNYEAAVSDADDYVVSGKDQNALSVNGVPAGTIHYGDSSFTLTTTGGSGAGAICYAVKSGTSVTVDASTGVVTITSAGTSVITVTKEGTADYDTAAADVTVAVAAKPLSLNSVKVSNKAYDGTTDASITEITLNTSDLLSGDTVDVSATAAFRDADVGTGKAVDLSDIQLSGADAGNYTIASTALNVVTADITKATPAVQLAAAPATGAVSGDTVTLTVTITGAASGASPSGTVTFYNGTTALGTGNCSGGQATFTWSNVPANTYSLTAQYAGDTNYKAAVSDAVSYVVSEKEQDAPVGLLGSAPTTALNNNGQIIGTTTEMEYKLFSDTSWKDVTGTSITGLSEGVYDVRYKAKTGYKASAQVEVTVPAYIPPEVSNEEKVAADIASLTWDAIRGTNTSTDSVTIDLNLSVTGTVYGSTITWVSGNPAVIDSNGTVTRPAYASGDADVTITATVKNNGVSDTKDFDLKVLKLGQTTYTISIGALAGGSIDADPTTAAGGATINLTITPDSGKRLKADTLKYNDGTDHDITGTSFTMPAADVTVTAEFEDIPPAVIESASISPSAVVYDLDHPADVFTTINWGDAQTVMGVVYGSDSLTVTDDYSIDGDKLTITGEFLSGLNLSDGDTAEIEISFDKGDSATMTVEAQQSDVPGTDASLSDLTVGGSTLDGFDAAVYEYNVELPFDTQPGSEEATVGAVATDTHAGAVITQAAGLPGAAEVLVTAEDNNTTQTYTIHFTLGEAPNTPPARKAGIPAAAAASVTVNSAYNLKLGTIFEDADADTLSYKVSINGAAAIAANSNYSYTPAAAGQTTLAFKANDGTTDSADTYTVTLTASAVSNNNHDSSGGGSSTVITPAAPPVAETTTNTTTSGNTTPTVTSTTTAAATSNANGSAAAAVTATQVTDAINQATAAAAQAGAGTAAQVEIKVTAPTDAKAVETSIPHAAVAAVADSTAGLTVSTPVAAIAFDGSALDTIAGAAAGDVSITASTVEAAALPAETQQVVGDRPVYSFSVTSGGNTISQFGGNVTVAVPYTLKPGEDASAIVIYYINAEGKPETASNCAYDPATGIIKFTTTHFSTYAVGYNKVAFKDVPVDAAYSKAVSFIAARGITTGTGNGYFSPEASITRGQFIVMIMRAYGIKPDDTAKDNFADAGNTYYTNYLSTAKRLGLTNGTGNNKYSPDKDITRQEMISLTYNTLKVMGVLPAAEKGKDLTAYKDANQIASWAKDAMSLFAKAGIVTGTDGKLMPTEISNRAQMAQVLYNLLSK